MLVLSASGRDLVNLDNMDAVQVKSGRARDIYDCFVVAERHTGSFDYMGHYVLFEGTKDECVGILDDIVYQTRNGKSVYVVDKNGTPKGSSS